MNSPFVFKLPTTYKIFPYDALDSIKSIALSEKINSNPQNIVYEIALSHKKIIQNHENIVNTFKNM